MAYSVHEQDGVLRAVFSGALTGAELHGFVDEIEALMAARAAWPDNLVDLRGVELSALGFSDIMSLAKRREAAKSPNAIRTALVAETPTMIGYARMFQSLNHNPNITIQVFTDLAEAETWLQQQPR